ncbi:RluA family pseudouridine synthase [Vallitalea okinawensis]|uniref:RluA family pseudouridine synthase n=1 Tax=Vallitalea okinawensis TaxID=2078660 RepID=UPI000CFB024C|nr:RNA pseudouridine synthase [Vallitalea okinawensis]
MSLNILFEDQHIIIVEKPPKVPVQSDPTGDMDLLTVIKEYLKQAYQVKKPYVGLIHRLDRPVGGIMVYAKTKFANSQLSQQVQNKKMEKTYFAVACGKPQEKQGMLINHLKKLGKVNMSEVVSEDTSGAKEALLNYHCLGSVSTEEGILSLLEIKLITGRHHQIRVQMAHAGIPLWGDNKYNKTFVKAKKWTQIALWAGELTFKHPKTKKDITYNLETKDIYPFNLFK